jgi:putative transposase/transposase-like zinc-binding protein
VTAHIECAARDRPRFEIGDLVRAHRGALEDARPLNIDQRRALSAIALCRTAELGGHLDVCTACGHQQPSYNSCRNRHCPKCQSLAQEKWVVNRLARILPVPHFHVVFTLPAALRSLAAYRPAAVYNLLFKTASATLLEVGRGKKLGALLGITAVLHTWTRELKLHPHLHCIVTAGGLATDGDRWIRSRADYLLPLPVLSEVFRGKFLAALRREHARDGFTGFDAFADPQGFERFCSTITKHRWVVYAKKPFAGPEHVFRYLGRYTHRVGIANSRLLDVTDDRVTFRTKNGKAITLTPLEFLTRFVQHILPKSYVKIRHYGLLAGSNVKTLLERARVLLHRALPKRPAAPATTWIELLLALTGRDIRRCSQCDGPVEMHPLPPTATDARARAPPTC